MGRPLFLANLAASVFFGLSFDASAQIRSYDCPLNDLTGEYVTVMEIGGGLLSAGLVRGQTFKFRQSTNDTQSFIAGNYILRLSLDRREIEIIHRDVANTVCSHETEKVRVFYDANARNCPLSNTCAIVLADLVRDSEYVGAWRQTKSSRFPCRDCEIVISRSAHGLLVASNIGWAGIVNHNGEGSAATGSARWYPGALSRQFGSWDLSLQIHRDGKTLEVHMSGNKLQPALSADLQLIGIFERAQNREREREREPASIRTRSNMRASE